LQHPFACGRERLRELAAPFCMWERETERASSTLLHVGERGSSTRKQTKRHARQFWPTHAAVLMPSRNKELKDDRAHKNYRKTVQPLYPDEKRTEGVVMN
jgi:hypothetical protein